MIFETPLVHGTLIRRYKRFLSDIKLDDGTTVIAHCTNSGSMKTCIEEGAEVYLSPAKDPKRKTRFTWEMIKINDQWVGVNTSHPNLIAFEAIKNGTIDKLSGYTHVQREVKTGDSRIDIMAQNDHETCFIEVKNVTMKDGKYARFPDAVTTRGKKHLDELIKLKKEGLRAVMLYIIQRSDVEIFAPAHEIDPDYAYTLKHANNAGVEIIPIRVKVSPNEINIEKELPFELDA
ncbi:DNA/RNA nuclease SfsA [Carboxylicivirga mesophila]|uniref:Sugar fermentation stimulation protein homolog n=1 Tax=Carboxylicivirga mesophila TaxID=1166478 RepID=A0ABS5K718_9BACT|nr:DNA/RNA nuclease SfsA [Carboxylicivirga mesophila]MBS2210794.1 DNA/RNA nuclease SfsA [Carboxylicivirga mesophila]